MKSDKKSFLQNPGVQSVLASLLCILIGLAIGYFVLLCINPAGAGRAMINILKNFLYFPRPAVALEYFGSTLVKTAPLLMCTLSVLFAYKVGLFNIGAAGQYTVGAGMALYFAIGLKMPWIVCVIMAMIGGALLGAVIGFLKAFLNVNEVIAGIMLNWISLYSINTLLLAVKESSTTYTLALRTNAPAGLLPQAGLNLMFSGNKYVTIAIPLAILTAVFVWFLLDKTRMGYELKATGLNKNAAKYAGMRDRQNMIVSMAISGAIAALGAAFLYLSGIEQWSTAQTSVPAMGFNGIAAAFLGGLNPIGCIFSAFFIQHITSGGSYIDKMVYSSQISDLISAIIIYFCGFVLFFKQCMSKGFAGSKKGGSKS